LEFSREIKAIKRLAETVLTYDAQEIPQYDTEISHKAYLWMEKSCITPWHVYCSTTGLVFIMKEEYLG